MQETWVRFLDQEDMSPRERNVNPLKYSCLENPMNRGAWWTIVHGVTKNWTRLSDYTTHYVTGGFWGLLYFIMSLRDDTIITLVVD